MKGEFHYQALLPAFLTTVISNEIAVWIGRKTIDFPKLAGDELSLLPITSIAMALEYFGEDEMVAIMIVMTISYIISGLYADHCIKMRNFGNEN